MRAEIMESAKLYKKDGSYIRVQLNDIAMITQKDGTKLIGILDGFLSNGLSITEKNGISHVAIYDNILDLSLYKDWACIS